jgi:hypothetical protein
VSTGEVVTRVSVWLVILAYFAASSGSLIQDRRGEPARWLPKIRRIWTVGVAAYIVHVLAAFHFYHGWSHAAALEDAARQTAAVTGWRWGGGLYVNYAFTVAWIADVLWQWRAFDSYQCRSKTVTHLWHGFFFFMVFNATVVFESGPVRAFGALGCGLLVVLYARSVCVRSRNG